MTPRSAPADLHAIIRDVANRTRNDTKLDVKFTVLMSKQLPQAELLLDQLHIRMVSGLQNCSVHGI